MQRFRSHVVFLLALGFFSVLATQNAHAYLDPASGSYFLQMLIAGILGGLFALKIFWVKIKSFFSAPFSKKDDRDENED